MAIPLNLGYDLHALPAHPAFAFRVTTVGKHTSFDGCHYRIGGYYCWHLVTRGRGTVRLGHRESEVGPGGLFTLQPDRELEYFDDPADPWEFYYFHLEGPAAAVLTEEAGFARETPWRTTAEVAVATRVFDRLWRLAQQPEVWQAARFNAEVATLTALLATPAPRPRRTAADLVEQAARLAAEPGYGRMNASELARSLHVDRGTLHRAFVAVTGGAPGAYLARRRLERARAMVTDPGQPKLSVVAAACGFANARYLIRAFTAAYGLSPGRYRRQAGVPPVNR